MLVLAMVALGAFMLGFSVGGLVVLHVVERRVRKLD